MSRFTPLRRPRMQTDAEWLANALSDARGAMHRADDTLAYDGAFDAAGSRATEEQAFADGVDRNDISEAADVERDARARVARLDAAALSFDSEEAAASLHAHARDLQEAADSLRSRIEDFAQFVPAADVGAKAQKRRVRERRPRMPAPP